MIDLLIIGLISFACAALSLIFAIYHQIQETKCRPRHNQKGQR